MIFIMKSFSDQECRGR